MTTYRSIFASLVAIVLLVLFVCTPQAPVDLSSPEQAYSTIVLTSTTMGKTDSTIVDSIGKPIGVTVAMFGGIFIDSLRIKIFAGYPGTAGAVLDSTIMVRFDENDLRDTLRFTLRYASSGLRYFELTTYKRLDYVSTTSATVLILGNSESNTPPVFLTNSPKLLYRFSAGDTVRFAVGATDYNNDPLTYGYLMEDLPLPRKETVQFSQTGGLFVWKSEVGDSGVYPIQFWVFDTYSRTELRTTLVIGDIDFNNAPRITSTPPTVVQSGTLFRYEPVAVDPDSNELRWSISGMLPENMVVDSLNGTILWNPSPGVTSSGRLVLRVVDDGVPAAADSQELRISVVGSNRPPVALSRSVATAMEQSLVIQLYATDSEGDSLTFTIVKNPPFGQAVLLNSVITYTPSVRFKGVDTILFVVSDALVSSDTAKVLIFVATENQKPLVVSRQAEIKEDVSTTISMIASDPEGQPLTYVIIADPRFGKLTGSTGTRVYTPNANFNGVDTFTFIANDGSLDSDPAVFYLRVLPVNDTPVAHDVGVPVAANTAVTVPLMVTDPDDSVFTLNVVAQPRHGTAEIVGALEIRYVPSAGFTGNDTVLFTVTDAQGLESDTAHITIAAGGTNLKPVATRQTVSMLEDSALTIVLGGTDPEGSALQRYTIVKRPTHGSLSNSGASAGYRPNLNYFGTDTLRFTVNDGLLDSDPADVIITILPVNDIPTVSSQSYTTQLNTQVMIALSAKDVDDDVFTYKVTTLPKYGTLDTSGLAGGFVRYIPATGSTQPDTIRYQAVDGAGGTSGNAQIVIYVLATNQRPVAVAQRVDINEDATTPIFLTGQDETPGSLIYNITVPPKHGVFEGSFPNISYKTEQNYNGPDTFWFKVSDGLLESDPARVVITILPQNDAPTVSPISVNTGLGQLVDITLKAYDVDDITFTYKMVTGPKRGTADVSAIVSGRIRYTPNSTFKGLDTITYQAFDDENWASGIGYIIIGVALNNQPPRAFADTITLNEDDSINVVFVASDVETGVDQLGYTISQLPAHGSVYNKSGRTVWYKPYANYNGTDAFLFTASDGEFTSTAARVWIVVNSVNDQPVAQSQSLTTELGAPVLITLSATDADGATGIVFRVTKMPSHGTADTLAIKNKQITYTPNASFKGLDTIEFVARDVASADSKTERIIIGVALDNQPPVADAKVYTGNEDATIAITLSGRDVENSPLTYIIDTLPKRGLLTGTGAAREYLPNADVNGVDSFYYHVNDGALSSAKVKVRITVNAVNDRPVAKDTTFATIVEDTPFGLTLPCSDADGNQLTVGIVTQPQHGTLEVLTGRNCRYTPATNYNGADAFTFYATDGIAPSETVTVSLVVAAVNDVPTLDVILPQTTLQGAEFAPLDLMLFVHDVESTPLQMVFTAAEVASTNFDIVVNPATKVLSVDAKSATWSGSASVEITATDAGGASVKQTVLFTVTEVIVVNVPPVAIAPVDPIAVTEDLSAGIVLSGSDPDNKPLALTFSLVTPPEHGTAVVGAGGVVTYIPNANYFGPDAFTFRVYDGEDYSAPATVSITVSAVNDAPTFDAIAAQTTLQGAAFALLDLKPYVHDVENTAAEITFTAQEVSTTHFNVGVNPVTKALSVATKSADWFGSASVEITATDAGGASVQQTVLFTVTEVIVVNVPPVAIAPVDAVVVTEDGHADIGLVGSDEDGPLPLTFSLVTPPEHGTAVVGAGGVVTYTPAANYSGPDAFTFRVYDGEDYSAPATVSISVSAVNDAPTITSTSIGDLSITVGETSDPIEFTIGDIDGNVLTVTAASDNSDAATVTVSETGDTRTCTVTGVAAGDATITITVSDGQNEVFRMFNVTVN